MKSYRLREYQSSLELEDLPTPEPRGSEVLLKVMAAGMCHSDLHLWDGGYDLGRGNRLSLADRGVHLPLTLGHEIVGQIVTHGPEAKGVERGKNYLIFPWIGCGECRVCLAGNENSRAEPRFGHSARTEDIPTISLSRTRHLLELSGRGFGAIRPTPFWRNHRQRPEETGGELIHEVPIIIFGAGGLAYEPKVAKGNGRKDGAVVVESIRTNASALEPAPWLSSTGSRAMPLNRSFRWQGACHTL